MHRWRESANIFPGFSRWMTASQARQEVLQLRYQSCCLPILPIDDRDQAGGEVWGTWSKTDVRESFMYSASSASILCWASFALVPLLSLPEQNYFCKMFKINNGIATLTSNSFASPRQLQPVRVGGRGLTWRFGPGNVLSLKPLNQPQVTRTHLALLLK